MTCAVEAGGRRKAASTAALPPCSARAAAKSRPAVTGKLAASCPYDAGVDEWSRRALTAAWSAAGSVAR